jgi:hypothetical protein
MEIPPRIELDVPDDFVELAAKFGFTAEHLASLLVIDFCARAPSCLWIVSDDPSISLALEESAVL